MAALASAPRTRPRTGAPSWWAGLLGLVGCVGACVLVAPAGAAETSEERTYCQYRYYHQVFGYCTDLPPAEAEKQCAEQASARHGEPIECACSDDPAFVEGRCGGRSPEEPPPPEPGEPLPPDEE